jgi:hypothetical protein
MGKVPSICNRRLHGQGETPWDLGVAPPIHAEDPGGLVLADLGTRPERILPSCPSLVIDHHVPIGDPQGAIIISGNGLTPEPTTALLAWWAASGGGNQDGLLVIKGQEADARALQAAKAEVRAAMDEAERVPPLVVGDVALIQLDSARQIHPLIAQQRRGRFRDKIVIASNRGYRPGCVHFAARFASGRKLVDFLAEHRPPNADGRYGNGHAHATGGALQTADWNSFVAGLGIPQAQVSA